MKIQALGCGCKRSVANDEAIVEATKELGIADEVEFCKDADVIMGMGIMSTPALVIDGKIYALGRVLTVEQAKALLRKAQSGNACSCEK